MNPTNTNLPDNYRLAQSKLQNGQWSEAVILLRQATHEKGHAHEIQRALIAAEAVPEGDALLAAGNISMAIQKYQAAINALPDFFRSYNHMGNAYLHAGDYPKALSYFLKAAEINPEYPATFYNIGNIYLATGNHEEAVRAFRNAITVNPDFSYAYELLGDACKAAGNHQDAIIAYERSLDFFPENSELFIKAAATCKKLGNYEGAINNFLHAIRLSPENAFLHEELGDLYLQLKDRESACEHYESCVRLNPESAHAWLSLGDLQSLLGQPDEALKSLSNVMRLRPDFSGSHAKAATILSELGHTDRALDAISKALSLDPDQAVNHGIKGSIYLRSERYEEALASFDRALSIQPGNTSLLVNKSFTLKYLRKIDDALNCVNLAIEIDAQISEAWLNKANILFDMNDFQAAKKCCLTALQLNPGLASAYNTLAAVEGELGNPEAMIENSNKALQINPDLQIAYNNLGKAYLELGDFEASSKYFLKAHQGLPDNPLILSNALFSLLNCEDSNPDQYLSIASAAAQRLTKKQLDTPSALLIRSRSESRKFRSGPLRVGMVSGDFKSHPVGYFLESILALINRETLHLTAYSNLGLRNDPVTSRLKSLFHEWREVLQMDDAELARQIQTDNIDILIDLSGHTALNRWPLFTWRPAPIQVSWLGYFASTGIPDMDYFLTDPVSSPPGCETQFTETLWYLPDTRLCFSAPLLRNPVTVSPLPHSRNNYITFGCFQRPSKINRRVIELWSRIMNAVAGSRLLLKCLSLNTGESRRSFLDKFHEAGIDPERIILEGNSSREEYLATYHRVDLMLDTFPFPGGTTTCEAMWMGVPTLTLCGETLIQRQGASLLAAAGLKDWIAYSKEEYVQKAIDFATDTERLSTLRAGLRSQIEGSPVMDARRFVQNLESALLQMWDTRANANPSFR